MSLVNAAKDRELTIAMKTARDLHARSAKPKADAFFVNSLEQKLLVMNEEDHQIQIHSWAWQFIPVVGAAALVTILSWKIMKPHRDISYEKEGGNIQQTFIEEPGSEQLSVLSPHTATNTVLETAAVTTTPLVSGSTK